MTTFTWLGSTGDWSQAADWNPSGPPTGADDAVIAAAGRYVVSIADTESESVGSVTLNDAAATLAVAGSLSVAGDFALQHGVLDLSGVLAGGTVEAVGGRAVFDLGTLDGVTWQGTLRINNGGAAFVENGLTMEGAGGAGRGTIRIDSPGSQLVFTDSETLDNTIINIGNASVVDNLNASGTLTLGGSTVLNVVGVEGFDLGGGGAIVNNGVINAAVAGGLDTIDVTGFVNAHALYVKNGTTLAVSSDTFSNTGNILIDGSSELDLFTSPTATQSAGGRVTIAGLLNAEGNTIDLGPQGAFAHTTLSGTLSDATVAVDGGAINFQLGTLDGVTWQGVLKITGAGAFVENGLTVERVGSSGPGIINIIGAASQLVFTDTETLDNLVINVGNASAAANLNANGSLTLGGHVTVNALGAGGFDLSGGGAIVNDGTINAAVAGGMAVIDVEAFANAGKLNVKNGATLAIASPSLDNTGTITVAGASELDLFTSPAATQGGPGTVTIAGLLNAEGSTIDLGASSAFAVTTLSGTLANATIVSDGGSIDFQLGSLDATTWQGTLAIGDSGIAFVANGLTMQGAGGAGPGSIDITGVSSQLVFTDSETLSNAVITIGNASFADNLNANGTLTLDGTVTLNAAGQGFDLGGGGELINQGTINAAVAGGGATIGVTTFANAGMANVLNGATLAIASPSFDNTGSIYVDGASELDLFTSPAATQGGPGTVTIAGLLNAEGNTIDLGASSAFAVTTLSGTLANATIVSDGGSIDFQLGSLDATTWQGTLAIGDSGIAFVANGLTMQGAGGAGPGSIDITGVSSQLVFTDSETLSNAVITIGNASFADNLNANGTLTLDGTVTLNAAGQGFDLGGGGELINQGTINAAVAGGGATIGVTTFANAGMANVLNGATLAIASPSFDNTGSIYVDGASELDLFTSPAATQGGPGTVTIAGLLNAEGNTIDLGASSAFAVTTLSGTLANATIVSDGGSIDFQLGSLDATTWQGTLAIGDSGIALVANGLTMEGAGGSGPGSIDLTGVSSQLVFTDSETLDNAVVTIGNAAVADDLNANGTLTLGSSLTLNAVAGTQGFDLSGSGEIVNEGAISGFGTVNLALVNNGTVVAQNGDLALLGGVSGTAALQMAAGATLELGTATSLDTQFNSASGTLLLDAPTTYSGTIHGFTAGGSIDLAGISFDPAGTVSVVGGATLEVVENSATYDFNFDPSQLTSLDTLGLMADPSGTGTDVIATASGAPSVSPRFAALASSTAPQIFHGHDVTATLGAGNATIEDLASGLRVIAGPGVGSDVITHAASDPQLAIDLVGGAGGYTSAAAACGALQSDGHGGSLLALGSGSIDFAGVPPAGLHASNFHIG